MLVVRDDTEKAIQYAIMRRRATGLLAAFFVLFVAAAVVHHSLPDLSPFWVGLVRAMAEAAIVGGIADWFAVTALFRHPLGIPIPHTAIVAQRKDRIGRSLGNFVGNNFLAADVIARQLAGMRLGERAARWLADPEHQARVARAIAGGVARAAESVPEDELQVERAGRRRDAAAEGAGRPAARPTSWRSPPPTTATRNARPARHAGDPRRGGQQGAHPRADRRGESLVGSRRGGRQALPEDRRRYRAHARPTWRRTTPIRCAHSSTSALRDFVEKLHNSPETIARAEAMKERLLEHPAVTELSGALLAAAADALARYGGPDAPSPEPLQRALGAHGGTGAGERQRSSTM